MIGLNGKISQVNYKLCSQIERCDKFCRLNLMDCTSIVARKRFWWCLVHVFELQKPPLEKLSIDFSSWDMAMILCEIVECNMREVLTIAKYISISIDEVFAIENINYIKINAYVLENGSECPLCSPFKRWQ